MYNVIIDVNMTEQTEVNETELINEIAEIAGVDPSAISVDVKVDDKGCVYRIIVSVADRSSADNIVTYLNDGKGKESHNPFLRQAVHASVIERSLSQASHQFVSSIPIICLMMIISYIIFQ